MTVQRIQLVRLEQYPVLLTVAILAVLEHGSQATTSSTKGSKKATEIILSYNVAYSLPRRDIADARLSKSLTTFYYI
jgi:hypothetical protein